MDARARILLADDHPGMLTALSRLLHISYVVVGRVRTGAEAMEAAVRLQPDVLLIDMMLPDINGLEVCRCLVASGSPVRVIIVTAADEPGVAQSALDSGASALVLKYRIGDDLVPAIERAVCPNGKSLNRLCTWTERAVEETVVHAGSRSERTAAGLHPPQYQSPPLRACASRDRELPGPLIRATV